MTLKDKKILVTGGAGFLGTYVIAELIKSGASKKNIIIPRSKYVDLRLKDNCLRVTKHIDLVIHLAGNVGGIGKNSELPGELFYDNITMGVHLIDACRVNKVKKLVIIGTICAYPKFTPVPFKEDDLWIGYPEETNAPYGLAKKILLVGAQAYRKQYGLNSIYLLLVNLYGPGDNFDPQSSHVIPALIRKMYDAKRTNKKSVTLWGDGSPTREFLFVEDAARGIVSAALRYDKPDPVNLGAGSEISIKDLVGVIAKLIGYTGDVIWDTTKPNGQPRRLLSTSRGKREFGFEAKTNFVSGLNKTIHWYEQTLLKNQ